MKIILGIFILCLLFSCDGVDPYLNLKATASYRHHMKGIDCKLTLRDGGKFSRHNAIILENDSYWGTYSIVNDTIYFKYQSEKKPLELEWGSISRNPFEEEYEYDIVLYQLHTYERDKYENVPNVDRSILGKTDTTAIKYNLVK
jgi:hypothetical protein